MQTFIALVGFKIGRLVARQGSKELRADDGVLVWKGGCAVFVFLYFVFLYFVFVIVFLKWLELPSDGGVPVLKRGRDPWLPLHPHNCTL